MLVEDQWVETSWNNKTKQWYEDKGYVFTKLGDLLLVKVEDLLPSSAIFVDVICDYCDEKYKIRYGNYNKGLKTINKSCCNK